MVKRCIYCNYELEEGCVIDICETCMYKVWGEKMAGAIVDNMKREKANGNLELGKVGDSNPKGVKSCEDLETEKIAEPVEEPLVMDIENLDNLQSAEEVVEQLQEPGNNSIL